MNKLDIIYKAIKNDVKGKDALEHIGKFTKSQEVQQAIYYYILGTHEPKVFHRKLKMKDVDLLYYKEFLMEKKFI